MQHNARFALEWHDKHVKHKMEAICAFILFIVSVMDPDIFSDVTIDGTNYANAFNTTIMLVVAGVALVSGIVSELQARKAHRKFLMYLES